MKLLPHTVVAFLVLLMAGDLLTQPIGGVSTNFKTNTSSVSLSKSHLTSSLSSSSSSSATSNASTVSLSPSSVGSRPSPSFTLTASPTITHIYHTPTHNRSCSSTATPSRGTNTSTPGAPITSTALPTKSATLFSRTTFSHRIPSKSQSASGSAEQSSSRPSLTESVSETRHSDSRELTSTSSHSCSSSTTNSTRAGSETATSTLSMTEDFTATPHSISAADSATASPTVTPTRSGPTSTLSIGTRSLTPSDRPSQTVSRSTTFSISKPSPTNEPSLTKSVTGSKGNLSHTRRTSPTILSDSITGSGDTNTRSASPSEERSPTVRSHSPTPTSSYRENSMSFSDHASSTTTATVSTTVTGALSVSETITSTEGSPSMTTTNSELFETYTWSTTSSIRDTPSESKADPTKTVSSEVTKSKSSSDIFIEVFHMEITLEVATTAAAAASLGIVLIGGMAPTARSDASAQALLMQIAPCISRDRDLTVDEMMTNRDNVGGRSVYGLSPFWDFGLLIAAYANIAVFVVFFWLYGGVVLVMGERAYHAEVAAAVSQSYGTKTAIDVDDEQEAAKLRRKGIFREWSRTTVEVASRLRFPSIPLRVVEVLLPGTTFCAVGYLLTAPSNTSGLPAGAVIAVVGTILLGFVGYLHVRIVPCLKYTAVHHPLLIPDAVSPYRSRLWIARLIPTHRWEPHILRPSFGTLYDSMNERYVRYRALDIGLVLSYSGMSALSTFGTGLSCIIGCGWMTLSMVIAALMTATHEMYRLPLDRVLVPFKHIIFAIICSLKTAGVEVPSWLYYVQFGVLLIRVAYGFWVKHEENRIVAIEAAVAQQPTSLDVRAEEWGSLVSSDDDEVGAGDARSTLAMFDLAAETPRRDKSDIRSTASRRSAVMQTPPDAAASVAILPPYWPPPTLPRAEFEREEHAAIWEVL